MAKLPQSQVELLSKIRILVRSEVKQVRDEMFDKFTALLTTAFGLVAALAWNEAVKATFQIYYPNAGQGLIAKYVYAIGVTVLAVLIIYLVAKKAKLLIKKEVIK